MNINREDMLALTRRMTVKRTSITRIAGAYLDGDGYVDGTFNINFLKLSPSDREKNLKIAKAVPFGDTNVQLKRCLFPKESMGKDSLWQLLMGIRSCGLKNDALLDIFYEKIADIYPACGDYAIYLFHDRYDIPAKAADHERLGESEQMFEYIIGAICPVSGDYEPGEVKWGFLFPAFCDGGAALNCVDIYEADSGHPQEELRKLFLHR